MDSRPIKGNKHDCLHGVVDWKRTLGNSKKRKRREGAKWHMVCLRLEHCGIGFDKDG